MNFNYQLLKLLVSNVSYFDPENPGEHKQKYEYALLFLTQVPLFEHGKLEHMSIVISLL